MCLHMPVVQESLGRRRVSPAGHVKTRAAAAKTPLPVWRQTTATPVGNVVWVLAVMIGSVASLKIVWSLADITNGLMALPNLISLIVLNKVIVSETREHLWNARE